jgi:acyl-[acyl-carrier-protein]-phospholipid O-acyltransferase / long-chain-fatty-acid--[acyl-carrier-protein] ligase
MASENLDIMKSRRFLPLFVTQFLGALNDNIFKNALVILVTFRIAVETGVNGQMMSTIAAGVFILPFFLFSATAGRFADKFDKQRMIAVIKTAEIAIMALAAFAFSASNLTLLMTVLFLMGTHSTFFGPLKYGILPVHLKTSELLSGNAFIEAGTFLAILIGTIAGGVLILTDHGIVAVSVLVLAVAVLGLLASLFIPRAPSEAPELKLGFNIVADTRDIIRDVADKRELFLTILGISWFWLIGATFLSQFPAFAKDVLGADDHVVTLFLTAFSLGIGVGSILCNKLLQGEISVRYVPAGALGVTLFTVDLYFASGHLGGGAEGALGIGAFLAHPAAWRVLVDLLLISIASGFYIVPLYTLMQDRSEPSHRSRVIAANNIINAVFMVAGSVATVGLIAVGFSVQLIFLTLGILNFGVAVYICRLLPDETIKRAFGALLRFVYRIELRGMENYKAAGERTVIVANHVSFLDATLLAALLPDRPTFAINSFIAQLWWVRPALALIDTFSVDPTNPLATKSLIHAVQAGKRCVIFPEGRITVTGALMKIYEGPGMIADKANAKILPIRIDGAQYTPFSRLRGKVRLRWFPKIVITIMPACQLVVDQALRGRARRHALGLKLYDLMTDLVFQTSDYHKTLFAALQEARRINGGRQIIIDDVRHQPLSYNKLIAASFVLGRRLAGLTNPGERIGVLLPNASAAAVTFFALQVIGRVPALLNFSTGLAGMSAACRAAELRFVLTSRQFLKMAKLEETAAKLAAETTLVFLEDIHARIGPFARLHGFASGWLSRMSYKDPRTPGDPAVVLFTSGSEGTPKGVVLSHENILANRYQLGALVDFNPTDTVFNALPLFHSFGLTGGLLLPLLAGVKTFLYPSPLHYRIVPELVYDTNATIMFGTDTFLAGYARTSHAYNFYSVRYVFAGAERVREETRKTWFEKFGLRILEGYGATEMSPVIALNTPMQFKAGTVGRFLPGIRHRLEPVPGVDEGGHLILSGPNVMQGYLRVEQPGVLEPPPGGAYATGDIVTIDDQGFVTILGRVKRFAKIAGEMVSLAAVEQAVARRWPDRRHAVVAVPDARKGEQLVLVTEQPGASRQDLAAHGRELGLPELFLPRQVIVVERLPVLGTGKADYGAIGRLAVAASAPAAQLAGAIDDRQASH